MSSIKVTTAGLEETIEQKALFELLNSVTVDAPTLIAELTDMVVALAVLSDALGIPDMMAAGLDKAQADVARGVRNGNGA